VRVDAGLEFLRRILVNTELSPTAVRTQLSWFETRDKAGINNLIELLLRISFDNQNC
jgi:hypothetical protein